MGRNVISVSFAHLPGNCGLAISQDGTYALTGSIDCAVRAHDLRSSQEEPWWQSVAGNEPSIDDVPATDLHDKSITDVALAPDSKTFATSSEDGFIRLFSAVIKPENEESSESLSVGSELVQACARFGAPARALDFSPTGTFLAAAGDEPGVLKIIVTAHPSTVNVLRSTSVEAAGHPIVALSFDPKSDFICTISSRGDAVIWCLDSGTCVGPIALNGRNARSLAWSPDGSRLVVGTDSGAVLVNREQWLFDKLLEDASGGDDDDDADEEAQSRRPSSSILAVAWSASGRYILTTGADSGVKLWDVASTTIISTWRANQPIQRVAWHPHANAFVVVDEIGQFGVVGDVIPTHLPSQHDKDQCSDQVELPVIPETGSLKRPDRTAEEGRIDENSDASEVTSDSGEDDIGDDGHTPVRRRKRLRRSPGRAGDLAEGSEGETNASSDEGTIRVESGDDEAERHDLQFDANDLDADAEEDAVELRRQREEERLRRAIALDDVSGRRGKHRSARRKSRGITLRRDLNEVLQPAQVAFVPSSTPRGEHSVKKRILCWTLTAALISYEEDTHDIVEVEFADATRRTVGIKDHFGFRLGCVGGSGVLLASPKQKDQRSMISFRPFASWSNNSEWTQPLADAESATTLALGDRFAAISTDQNVVRLFSLSGIQVDTFGMPGRIVTMAAIADRLAVVVAPLEFASVLKYQLLEVASSGSVVKMLASDELVLSPKSKLEWFGFTSDTKDLLSYDSSGTVWLQVFGRGGLRWLPMLRNASKAADCDWFWLAAATSESVVGAQCFSSERHPPAKPRPSLRTVPLFAPVIDQIGKNGQASVQERLFRSQLRLSRAAAAKTRMEELYGSDGEEVEDAEERATSTALEVDKCILGLMEVACRQEQNLRAYDLATRLNSTLSFKFAINLANHYKRSALAGRVEALAHRRMLTDGSDNVARRPGHLTATRKSSALTQNSQSSEDSPHEANDDSMSDDEGHKSAVKNEFGNESDDSDEGAELMANALAKRRRPESSKSTLKVQTSARSVGVQRSYGPKKTAAAASNRFAKRG